MKKVIVAILFLIIVFFNVVILKPTTKGVNNQDLQVPDISFGYDGEDLYTSFFSQISNDQIPEYKTMMLWDYLYPVIYTAFLFLMGQLLFSKGLFSKIFFITVATAFIFDYAENFTILYLLNELPTTHIPTADLLGILTIIKWVAGLFSIIAVVAGLIQAGIKTNTATNQ
jgi:hypothetical protein